MGAKWTLAQQRLYRRQVAEIAGIMPFDDDCRRAFLERVTGKASTGDCDRDEMRRVIDAQERLLRQNGATRPQAPRRRRVNQEEYLSILVRQLGWEGQPERLEGMIRRQFGGWKRALGDLDVVERSKFIAALKALVRDERRGRIRADRPIENRPAPRPDWKPEVISSRSR